MNVFIFSPIVLFTNKHHEEDESEVHMAGPGPSPCDLSLRLVLAIFSLPSSKPYHRRGGYGTYDMMCCALYEKG